MKKIISVFVISATISCVGQVTAQKVSNNNYFGKWVDNISWTGGTAPGTSNLPANEDIAINGYIERGDSPAPAPGSGNVLQFRANKEAYNFYVNDTLVVYGDVTFENKAMNLVIGPGAVFIIFGNLNMNNKIDIDSDGTLVVTGNFDKSGSQGSFTGTGDVYVGSYSGDAVSTIDGGTGDDSSKTIDQLSDDGFTDIEDFVGGGGTSPLPIELVSFNVIQINAEVHLQWVTAKELNFSHFEIQRATGSDQFETIGKVSGSGDSQVEKAYSFIDYDNPKGKIYYRLKSVDIDGTFEFSDVLMLTNALAGGIGIYPNPVTSSRRVKIMVTDQAFSDSFQVVSLYDLQGNLVQRAEDVELGEELEINSEVKSGLYVMRVYYNNLEENIRIILN